MKYLPVPRGGAVRAERDGTSKGRCLACRQHPAALGLAPQTPGGPFTDSVLSPCKPRQAVARKVLAFAPLRLPLRR